MRKRLPIVLLLLLACVGLALAGHGHGKQVRYVGPHPIPKEFGGGFCHIQVPHVHVYAPVDAKLQYREDPNGYYFVGDPVAYGWDGPKYAYYGHHPVPVGATDGDDDDHDVEYCYIDGPHYHYYAPPADVQFELKGGAYWYVGDFPQAYVDARPALDPIDTEYVQMHYERPVVVVDAPPPAWVGFRFAAGGPAAAVVVDPPHVDAVVEGPHAEVVAPTVVAGVQVTAPSLHVEVGVPSVVVGVGGGVIVGGDGDEHEHEHGHWHHDNGRHLGWYKHGGGGGGREHVGRGRGHWKHW